MPEKVKRSTAIKDTVAGLNKQLRRQTTIARQERAKGQALLASIGEGLIATDEYGKIIQVNQVALDMLKFTRKELIGSWFLSKILAVDEDGIPVDPLERPASKIFITGKTVTDILYYKTKNGEMIPVQLTISPIFLRDRPIGAIEIFRDISEELEIDKQKSEFISLASHQLRTPLSSINVFSHMLKDGYGGKLTRKQNDLLNVVTSSADRMNNLINTLLNITRAETNNISVESRPLNLDKLLNDLMKAFEPRFHSKQIMIKRRVGSKIPVISTDQSIISEILSNLISNSLKYTPPDGSITVSLRKRDDKVLFSISDTGYGIPLESQPFIFTKFFRAVNIVPYDVTGTGLGLYITKILAAKVNADIWFKSQEGKGTTFYLAIPISGNVAEEGRFKLEAVAP